MRKYIAILISVLICVLGCSKDERAWKEAVQSGAVDGFVSYIESFGPSGRHYQEALAACDTALWNQAIESEDYKAYIAWRAKNLSYMNNEDRIETAKFRVLLDQPSIEACQSFMKEFPDSKNAPMIEDTIKICRLDKKFKESHADSDLDLLENAIVDNVRKFGVQKRLVLKGIDATNDRAGKYTVTGTPQGDSAIIRTEFSCDSMVYSMMDGRFSPHGDGTVSRIDGEVPARGLNVQPGSGKPSFVASTIQSNSEDKFNRLTFVLLKDVGMVHLRGNGVVKGQQGEILVVGESPNQQVQPTPSTGAPTKQ